MSPGARRGACIRPSIKNCDFTDEVSKSIPTFLEPRLSGIYCTLAYCVRCSLRLWLRSPRINCAGAAAWRAQYPHSLGPLHCRLAGALGGLALEGVSQVRQRATNSEWSCQHVQEPRGASASSFTSVASCSEPGLTAVTSEPFNGLFRTVKANHVLLLTT